MKTTKIIAFVLSLAAVLSCARLGSTAEAVSDKVLRLHVVAQSDSDTDQALKLKARDAVLDCMEPYLDGCTDRDDAEKIAEAHLDEIAQAASAAAGQPAVARISRESFPERDYDGFALPAGEYLTLRVTLGKGLGHNWWCVVFPPLCTALASGDGDAAFSLFDEDEQRLISGSGRVVKFRVLEWIEEIRKRV